MLLITGVDVGEDTGDGYVAQCFFKEEQFDGGGAHQTEAGQQEQEPAEACQLSRVALAHVVGQNALGLVLHQFHRTHI